MKIHQGDCLEVLKTLKANSVDSLVTDPPAGIAFMGKDWDSDKGGRDAWIAWMGSVMRECNRVLKPGAHALVWTIPRTSHWTATAVEDAGFEVRDVVTHLFGSGFPKSLNISIAIDKSAGAIGNRGKAFPTAGRGERKDIQEGSGWTERNDHKPITPEAKRWEGFGTALKPAAEFWILARKPLSEKTVAENVLTHGTGGINIDGCRIETSDYLGGGGSFATGQFANSKREGSSCEKDGQKNGFKGGTGKGRFPANLVLSHSPDCVDGACAEGCAVAMLDRQSGHLHGNGTTRNGRSSLFGSGDGEGVQRPGDKVGGGASRFYYCAKTSTAERNAGLDGFYVTRIDFSAWNAGDTEVATLLLKAILGSMPNLSIDVFGERITVTCPKDSLSTTKTAISKITESKTWNSWIQSLTSGCIPDAKLDAENGLSHAPCVEKLKEWIKTTGISHERAGSAITAAALATLSALSKIKENDAWQPLQNSHPTLKSLALMRYLIRLITPPGGTVLDPFMGSGSTGAAAIKEGFHFIGIEMNEEYVQIAKKRIYHKLPSFIKQVKRS